MDDAYAQVTASPHACVLGWLQMVFDEDDLYAAWSVTDEPFRVAHVQAWLYNTSPGMPSDARERLTDALSTPRATDPQFAQFADYQTRYWRAVMSSFVTDRRHRAVVGQPFLVGVDLEAVYIADVARAGTFEADAELPVHRFLVRHTDHGCRLAGTGGVLPVPGWPPSHTDRFPM